LLDQITIARNGTRLESSYPAAAVLEPLLAASSLQHRHVCPRQVLGIRIGLCGLRELGLIGSDYAPRFENHRKQLLTIVETDGCGADGVSAATDCWVGRRTLRVVDYGKVAATLMDTKSGRAIRIVPRPDVRQLARNYAAKARSRWHAYLEAYQVMPDEALLIVQPVALRQSLTEILSRPSARAVCGQCTEEIINEREVLVGGRVLCRACAGGGYYRVVNNEQSDNESYNPDTLFSR
jgi:formylmethanofuran dehydrogenase subunit E